MFRLKRFGAMASVFSKNNNRRGKSLKRALFVRPLAILVLVFGMIVILFNSGLRYFTNQQVNEAIQYQFDVLDAHYIQKEIPDSSGQNLFNPTYVLIDESHQIVYLSASQDDLTSSAVSENVVTYFYEHDDDWEFFDEKEAPDTDIESSEKGSAPVFVTLGDSRYAVKIREYEGRLQDYFIIQDKTQEETYYALVFVNTDPLESFSWLMNAMLLVLMVVFGLFATGLMYGTAKSIDRDFSKVTDYIRKIGRREFLNEPEKIVFDEFYDVQKSVIQMQQLLEKNERSQQLFFQNVSHELRTPLMSIQGYAEAIENGVFDETTAARIIQEESHKMKGLVDDILQLSRMEEVQSKLEIEETNLEAVIFDATGRLKQMAEQKGVAFYHEFATEGQLLSLDERLVEQAIGNILSNALRYAKTSIWIRTAIRKNHYELAIVNDGPVILPEEMEHIFDRFYKGRKGNVGIGLALAKEIMERHGGQLSVTSTEKETAFHLLFPL